jgi:hypothetical protein
VDRRRLGLPGDIAFAVPAELVHVRQLGGFAPRIALPPCLRNDALAPLSANTIQLTLPTVPPTMSPNQPTA